MPRGSDEGFAEKIRNHHAKHSHLKVPMTVPHAYTVCHYAGEVTYTAGLSVASTASALRRMAAPRAYCAIHAIALRASAAIRQACTALHCTALHCTALHCTALART